MSAAPADAHARIATLLQQGVLAAAEQHAAALRAQYPQDAELARLHGLALLLQGRADAACAALETATRLAPAQLPAWLNLASAARQAGDLARAEQALHAAAALDAAHPALPALWGGLYFARGDLAAARVAYAEALARESSAANVLNLAAVELALGEPVAAAVHCETLLRLPDPPAQAYALLAQAQAAQTDFAAAAQSCAQGLVRHPDDVRLLHQAGLAQEELGDHESAMQCYRAAAQRAPDDLTIAAQLQFAERQCCAWDALATRSAWLRTQLAAGRSGIAPFAFLAESASAGEQRHCGAIAAQRLPARTRAAPRVCASSAPLRVGLISAGFHQHATALLLTPMLEALAQDAGLSLHLYALSRDDGSAWRQRLAALAPLRDVHALSDAHLFACLRADALDVLVDIEAWCGGGRPAVLAQRPAPCQVNWLGYPGSSGAPWHDALIADAFVLPPASRAHCSEHVVLLPRCYQPVDAQRAIAPPPSRAALGLPDAALVYASFGQNYKLTPPRYAGMLAVLRAVPDSVLWLLASHAAAQERLRAAAAAADVDPARIVFAARRAHADYLGLFQHADLLLDTHPYNAHTTASDALYAGCPVLTTPGDTFAARVAGSLNHHAGLDDCNARDEADFVARAIALGHDAAARQALRARVAAARAGSVFDASGYARDFAVALRACVA